MGAVVYHIAMETQQGGRGVSFGEAVRHRRKIMGLTQGELARLMAVSQNTVSRWEIAARAPDDPYVVQRLSEVLHVDPDDLRAGIIRKSAPPEDVHEQLVKIAAARATTPEELELLVGVIEKALASGVEGLRRIEDYASLVVERFGRAEDENEDEDEEGTEGISAKVN